MPAEGLRFAFESITEAVGITKAPGTSSASWDRVFSSESGPGLPAGLTLSPLPAPAATALTLELDSDSGPAATIYLNTFRLGFHHSVTISTSIGVATAQQAKGLASASATGVWGGQTVTGSDTLVMYTYGGDANLDGKINVDDYGHIDTSIGIGLNGWFNGDFNFDGKINVDDYGIIDFNIGIQGPPL